MSGVVGVAAVILAAGVSSRLGCPKQLLPWDGESLLARVARQVLGARVDPVLVVLGHRAEEVGRALEPLRAEAGGRLQLVFNPDYREGGQSSSVRAGVRALPAEMEAALFVLGDQPLLRTEHVENLLARYLEARAERGQRVIVVSAHQGRRGHPVLFGRDFFPELERLSGDEGGRSLLRKHPEAVVEAPAGEEVLLDLDTWEDYRRLRDRSAPGGVGPGEGEAPGTG